MHKDFLARPVATRVNSVFRSDKCGAGLYWNSVPFRQGRSDKSVAPGSKVYWNSVPFQQRRYLPTSPSEFTSLLLLKGRLSFKVLSVCNESVNFSLENSESLLESPTISRWLHGVFADSLHTESTVGQILRPHYSGNRRNPALNRAPQTSAMGALC